MCKNVNFFPCFPLFLQPNIHSRYPYFLCDIELKKKSQNFVTKRKIKIKTFLLKNTSHLVFLLYYFLLPSYHHRHPVAAAQGLERFNYNDGPLSCLSCLASYGPYVKSIKWSSPNKGNQRRRLFASFYAQQQRVSILLLRETLFFLCYPKKDDISLLQLQSTSTNRIRII